MTTVRAYLYGASVLVAAAFCPHPPALIPDLAAGAAGELDPLRAACRAALDELVATAPDLVVVVGSDQAHREHGPEAVGSLAPYGVDRRAGRGSGPPELPLSLTVGAWLLDLIGWTGPRLYQGVEPSATPADCAELGAALALRADRVGLLVMGDGSARRSPTAPGFVDTRAADFDASVAPPSLRVTAMHSPCSIPSRPTSSWLPGGRPGRCS